MKGRKPKGKADRSQGSQSAGRQLGSPRSIRETHAWRQGQRGVKQFWHNYLNLLRSHFRNMTRRQQEELISKLSWIITVGVTVLIIMFFHPFMPLLVRLLGVPLALAGAWWAGTRIISPIMIRRLEQYLNQDYAP